jgi:hypothetical protein
VPCKLVCPFELSKLAGSSTMKWTAGSVHVINRRVTGMLLLLPGYVHKRQIVEVHLPSTAKKKPSIKLMEVCWIRSISVSARVKMYLAGTRALFELPASG